MSQVPDLPDLSGPAVTAYQRILDGETLAPETPGLESLLKSGLAVAYPYTPDTYTPVQPGHAALQMMQIMHTQMSALAAYAGAMPGLLLNLRDRYHVNRSPDAAVQHLVGRKLINERIAAEHSAAREDISAAQPGSRKPEDLALSFERDAGGLRRGLAMRTIYNDSVRRVTAIGSWAKEMAALGGEIRTFQGRFPRSIIFYRRVAFIPVYTDEGEGSPDEAVMITDPLVVARIAHVFDLIWERADLWLGARTSGLDQGLTTNATQRSILRELCRGRNQKRAAKNVGISAAWLNNQLRDLRLKLGVETLNEVIYWWVSSPDHNVHD
ncbi:hypothetical protein ABZV67_21785 [Streptomyces sp. NPDC005065]|uniref:hypothetical protein n=1 Tax=Streptomyces sp. NPDC005065 TaxID=3154461 RepID=UPI0033A5336B